MRVLAAVSIALVVAGCATVPQQDAKSEYERGYGDAVHALDETLFSPVGIGPVMAKKMECERVYKTRCGLYGGYAPLENIRVPEDPSKGSSL